MDHEELCKETRKKGGQENLHQVDLYRVKKGDSIKEKKERSASSRGRGFGSKGEFDRLKTTRE